jgi:hypothetical protein
MTAMMQRKSREYSLTELLEHPMLRVQMANEGIENRSLDLILDASSTHHRFVETGLAAQGGFAYPCPD